MLIAMPGWSVQYSMTEVMIWQRAREDWGPMARSRSLLRSMQERTCERDLAPTKQMEVTKTSVEGSMGSSTPNCLACSSMDAMTGWISSSLAFLRMSCMNSLPCVAYGVARWYISQHSRVDMLDELTVY